MADVADHMQFTGHLSSNQFFTDKFILNENEPKDPPHAFTSENDFEFNSVGDPESMWSSQSKCLTLAKKQVDWSISSNTSGPNSYDTVSVADMNSDLRDTSNSTESSSAALPRVQRRIVLMRPVSSHSTHANSTSITSVNRSHNMNEDKKCDWNNQIKNIMQVKDTSDCNGSISSPWEEKIVHNNFETSCGMTDFHRRISFNSPDRSDNDVYKFYDDVSRVANFGVIDEEKCSDMLELNSFVQNDQLHLSDHSSNESLRKVENNPSISWSSLSSFKTSFSSQSTDESVSRSVGIHCTNDSAQPTVNESCSQRISPRIFSRRLFESQKLIGDKMGPCVTRSIGFVGSLSLPNQSITQEAHSNYNLFNTGSLVKRSDSRSHLIDHTYYSESCFHGDVGYLPILHHSRGSPIVGRKYEPSPGRRQGPVHRHKDKDIKTTTIIKTPELLVNENRSMDVIKCEIPSDYSGRFTPRKTSIKEVQQNKRSEVNKHSSSRNANSTEGPKGVRKQGRPRKVVKSDNIPIKNKRVRGHGRVETPIPIVGVAKANSDNLLKNDKHANEINKDGNTRIGSKRVVHLPGRYWKNCECPMAVETIRSDLKVSDSVVSNVCDYSKPSVQLQCNITPLEKNSTEQDSKEFELKSCYEQLWSSAKNGDSLLHHDEPFNEMEFDYLRSSECFDVNEDSMTTKTGTNFSDEETRSNFNESDDEIFGMGLNDNDIEDWSNSAMTDDVDFDTMADKVCVVMLGALGEAELDMLESRLCDRSEDVEDGRAETVTSEEGSEVIMREGCVLSQPESIYHTPTKHDYSMFLPSPESSPPFTQSFSIPLSQSSQPLSQISVVPISDSEMSRSQQLYEYPLSPSSPPSKSPDFSMSEGSLLRSISPAALFDLSSSHLSPYLSESRSIQSVSQTSLISDLVSLTEEYICAVPSLTSTDVSDWHSVKECRTTDDGYTRCTRCCRSMEEKEPVHIQSSNHPDQSSNHPDQSSNHPPQPSNYQLPCVDLQSTNPFDTSSSSADNLSVISDKEPVVKLQIAGHVEITPLQGRKSKKHSSSQREVQRTISTRAFSAKSAVHSETLKEKSHLVLKRSSPRLQANLMKKSSITLS